MENLNGVEKLRPIFGHWCHKIIPLIYDDSLSYYEVLCKLTNKINSVIDTVNGLIDADIEGYLKDLIDEYATQVINELIDEIGETRLRELTEQICIEYLDEFKEDFLSHYSNKIENMAFVEAVASREYWFDGWDAHILTGVNAHKCDSCLVDNVKYYFGLGKYIFEVSKSSYSITPHLISSFTGSKLGHVTHNDTHIIASDGINRIFYISKSDFTVTHVYTTSIPIGSIAYDRVTGKLYCGGRMAEHTESFIYEVTFNGDFAYTTKLGQFDDPDHHMMVYQNMCAYNGIIYHTGSNPNCIIVTETDGTIIQRVNLVPRMDYIMPIGELQGIDYYDGKIYIQGYSGVNASGRQHINALGYLDLKYGNIVLNSNFQKDTYAGKILYVDADMVDGNSTVRIPHPNSIHYHYNKYTATGWFGDYEYLPFNSIWEAVECAVGFKEYFGVKSIIRIVANNHIYGSSRIPAYAVTQVSGFHPNDGNVYWRCRGFDIYDGSVEIIRCGLTGMRGNNIVSGIHNDVGYADDAAVLSVNGARVKMTNCNILWHEHSVLSSSANPNITYFVKTSNGGYLEFGNVPDPTEWGANFEMWGYEKTVGGDNQYISHFSETSGKYMNANSGIINIEAFHDWQNTELFPYGLTRGGCFVGQMRTWNESQSVSANTGLVIPERGTYEYWHTFDIWFWNPASPSYVCCVPVRGITTHAGNNRPVTLTFGGHTATITMNSSNKLVITPDFNCRIQMYLRKL